MVLTNAYLEYVIECIEMWQYDTSPVPLEWSQGSQGQKEHLGRKVPGLCRRTRG